MSKPEIFVFLSHATVSCPSGVSEGSIHVSAKAVSLNLSAIGAKGGHGTETAASEDPPLPLLLPLPPDAALFASSTSAAVGMTTHICGVKSDCVLSAVASNR